MQAITKTLFSNLGEQIEFGALANSCGFGTIRKGESSFRCIADEMQRLREENEKLKNGRKLVVKYKLDQNGNRVGEGRVVCQEIEDLKEELAEARRVIPILQKGHLEMMAEIDELKAKLNEEEEGEEHDCCGDCIAFDQVEDYIFGRLKDICREENLDYPQFDAVAITNELGSALRLKRELDALKAKMNEVELNEDEDQGFCKVCKKWEPVSKFLEGDVLTQPCKSCFKEEEEEDEDDEMEVYSETDNFGQFCGEHEHLKEFHNCRYYECWGGGSQGGFIVNEKNDVFRVERNWGTPFKVEKVAGFIKEIERDGLKFIRVI